MKFRRFRNCDASDRARKQSLLTELRRRRSPAPQHLAACNPPPIAESIGHEHQVARGRLGGRKTNLARLLRGRPDGIFVAPFEPGEIGTELFGAACRLGLEGLVSKRRDRRYSAGRSKDWIKVKNRTHPAMDREF